MVTRRDAPRTRVEATRATPTAPTPTVFPPAGTKQTASSQPRKAQPPKSAGDDVRTDLARAAGASRPHAEVSYEARYRMISEAAYLRAERRGFTPGSEIDDWLAAEQEVERLLAGQSSIRQ